MRRRWCGTCRWSNFNFQPSDTIIKRSVGYETQAIHPEQGVAKTVIQAYAQESTFRIGGKQAIQGTRARIKLVDATNFSACCY
jgi:hypothetical protein